MTRQDRTEQDIRGQEMTGQDSTGQARTRKHRTRKDRTRDKEKERPQQAARLASQQGARLVSTHRMILSTQLLLMLDNTLNRNVEKNKSGCKPAARLRKTNSRKTELMI